MITRFKNRKNRISISTILKTYKENYKTMNTQITETKSKLNGSCIFKLNQKRKSKTKRLKFSRMYKSFENNKVNISRTVRFADMMLLNRSHNRKNKYAMRTSSEYKKIRLGSILKICNQRSQQRVLDSVKKNVFSSGYDHYFKTNFCHIKKNESKKNQTQNSKQNLNYKEKTQLRIQRKMESDNLIVPPFEILQDRIFKNNFNPYLVFHYLFEDHITEVKSIKNVFKYLKYFGEGAFSIVLEVNLKNDPSSYVLKSIKLSDLTSVNRIKHLLV